MRLLEVIETSLKAATMFMRYLAPLAVSRQLNKDLDNIEDEILNRSINATESDILQIEKLKRRESRLVEQLGTLRSVFSDIDSKPDV